MLDIDEEARFLAKRIIAVEYPEICSPQELLEVDQ